jgi:two-component sensor histidine kinase
LDMHLADAEARIRDLEAALRRKEAVLREVQHRAKNGLQLAISLLRLQVGRMRDPDARAAFEETLHRVEALTLVYRQLHESGAEDAVDLDAYLAELARLAASPTDVDARGPAFEVEVRAEPIRAGLTVAMTLGLAVNELILASQRHAFSGTPRVEVALERLPGGLARLTVDDNGRAIPAGFDEAGENGMMLIEALAAQIGGTVERDDDGRGADGRPSGARAVMVFPVG